MRYFGIALLVLLAVPSVSWAEVKNETLLQSLPLGYKIDFQARQGNMGITEMVPQAESVENWTEMVTTQVFFGLKSATPEQFQANMEKNWLASCKAGQSASIANGAENGYPFTLWLLSCPLNPATGKPEITWFKAIKGNDSFYVVQKAFRFEPAREQVMQSMQYLRKVSLCDTRLPDRACPRLGKVNQ